MDIKIGIIDVVNKIGIEKDRRSGIFKEIERN